MLVLDTSILIDIERGDKSTLKVLESMIGVNPALPRISYATYIEYYYGGLRIGKKELAIREELSRYTVVESTPASNENAARIRAKLEEQGKVISASDVLIAASTIAIGATLVTKDKHFKRVSGLRMHLIEE